MMVKDIIIVVGATRTGSSLTCDLLAMLGADFGDEQNGPHPPNCRHAHRRFWGGLTGSQQLLQNTITSSNVNAFKFLHNIESWVGHIKSLSGVRVRWIITTRNYKDCDCSQAEITPRTRNYNDHYLHIKEQLIDDPGQEYLLFPLELTLDKNPTHLRRLMTFIGVKKDRELLRQLTTLITPGTVKNDSGRETDYLKKLFPPTTMMMRTRPVSEGGVR